MINRTSFKQIPNTRAWIQNHAFKILSYILNDTKTIVKDKSNHILIKVKNLKYTTIKLEYTNSMEFIETIHFKTKKETRSFDNSLINQTLIHKHLSQIADKLYLKSISEEELKIFNNVFFENKQCPICESKALFHQSYSDGLLKTVCNSNNCYSIEKYPNRIFAYIRFFDKTSITISQVAATEEKIARINQIQGIIDDYKYNEKYLMDILAEDF